MLFQPSDNTFFDLFDRVADNLVHSAELFLELLRNYEIRKEFATKIRQTEHEGDSIMHEAITKLNKTFFTPLDREDIHALMSQSDDVVDYLDAAAARLILYGVEKPSEDMLKQGEVVVQIARCLGTAIKEVRHIKKNQKRLETLLIEINDWENRGDEHNHAALARLFETNDPMHVLKWKELYEMVENAIDSCERTAHIIRSIMVKNA